METYCIEADVLAVSMSHILYEPVHIVAFFSPGN